MLENADLLEKVKAWLLTYGEDIEALCTHITFNPLHKGMAGEAFAHALEQAMTDIEQAGGAVPDVEPIRKFSVLLNQGQDYIAAQTPYTVASPFEEAVHDWNTKFQAALLAMPDEEIAQPIVIGR